MTETAIIKETGENPRHSIIWLHGLGADGNDFVPIIPALGLNPSLAIRFIFPHAKVRPITINGGMPMRGWYDIESLEVIRKEDRQGLQESSDVIEQLIAEQVAQGIALDNIILAGFSQGGALALYHGLRRQQPLAAIIALSCYLPFHQEISELSEVTKKRPIFMAHGTQDEVVSFEKGALSKQALVEHDYDVKWHEYAIGHSVSMDEIQDIGQFINRVFK